jgi:hypothetical protein
VHQNVALNLIESLRNTEAMGVWVIMAPNHMSGAVRSQLTPLEKAFLEEAFAFLTMRAYYVLHKLPLLSQDLFLSARTPHCWGRCWAAEGNPDNGSRTIESTSKANRDFGLYLAVRLRSLTCPYSSPSNVHATHFCMEASLVSSSTFQAVMCTLNFLSPPT